MYFSHQATLKKSGSNGKINSLPKLIQSCGKFDYEIDFKRSLKSACKSKEILLIH